MTERNHHHHTRRGGYRNTARQMAKQAIHHAEDELARLKALTPDEVMSRLDVIPAYSIPGIALAQLHPEVFHQWVAEVEADKRFWYARGIDHGLNPDGIVARTWRADGTFLAEQMVCQADLADGTFSIDPDAVEPSTVTLVFDGDDGHVIAVLDARRMESA